MAIRREGALLSSRKQIGRLVTIVLVAIIVLSTGVPRVLGMTSPRKLSRSTIQVRTISVNHISPGDSLSDTVEVHNDGAEPLDYLLVFVQEGNLWGCDPGGNSLYFDVTWDPGADQHLEPGEAEMATINVYFPLAAGNACQGETGTLRIRQGSPEDSEGGLYECRQFSILPERLKARGRPHRYMCWDMNGTLHALLRRRGL